MIDSLVSCFYGWRKARLMQKSQHLRNVGTAEIMRGDYDAGAEMMKRSTGYAKQALEIERKRRART